MDKVDRNIQFKSQKEIE